MMNSEELIDKIIGEQLSSVEFVQDYLQLHFDGRNLTTYIWPVVLIGENTYSFPELAYRNVLCDLIGLKVEQVNLKTKKYLEIIFAEKKAIIRLNLNPSNPEIVSEIAIFNDSLEGSWSVFE